MVENGTPQETIRRALSQDHVDPAMVRCLDSAPERMTTRAAPKASELQEIPESYYLTAAVRPPKRSHSVGSDPKLGIVLAVSALTVLAAGATSVHHQFGSTSSSTTSGGGLSIGIPKLGVD